MNVCLQLHNYTGSIVTMEFASGSSVLLVGEGDFSFTKSLYQQGRFVDVRVVTSCFQQELSERTSANAHFLQEKGIEVLLGVDATKLEMTPGINDFRFSYVVFNFPHVGGKMKIHLNRNLLLEFFKSASPILEKNGKILVTLCGGQGGIPLDPVVRRWSDTWQVVLMASRASLVLRKVENFESSNYYDYSCIGYRSMEKGFDQKGAFIYVFERCPKEEDCDSLDPLCTNYILLYNKTSMRVPGFISDQLNRKLCSDSSSLLGQLCDVIKNHFSSSLCLLDGKDIVEDENFDMKDISENLNLDLYLNHNEGAFVHPLYILKNSPFYKIDILLLFVFREKNMFRDILLQENIAFEIRNLSKSLTAKLKTINMKDFVVNSYTKSLVDSNIPKPLSSSTGELSEDLHIFALNLISMAQYCFDVDEDELWADGQVINRVQNYITYSPYGLFPLVHIYDLSFWQPAVENEGRFLIGSNVKVSMEQQIDTENCLDFDIVGTIITNVAQDNLVQYELLSTYFHLESMRRSFTFRMKYRSYYGSLSDCKAKKLHKEIGLKLEEILGVEVR